MRVAMSFRRKQHADVGGKKPAKAEPGKCWHRAGCRSGRAQPLRTLPTNVEGIRGGWEPPRVIARHPGSPHFFPRERSSWQERYIADHDRYANEVGRRARN